MSPLAKLRAVALASCSLLALHAAPAAGQTAPASGPVGPLYGNISPFYGNLSPFYGNLSPFYGNLSPFYGNLSPFWGNLSPFYGNLSPFWGNLSPFTANTTAAVTNVYGTNYDPFWGGGSADPYIHNPSPNVNYSQIAGFWSTEGASWTKVQSAWSAAQTSSDYANVAALLQTSVLNPASAFWSAAVTQATKGPSAAKGSSNTFANDFSNGALANAGVTLNADGSINAASLSSVSPTSQQMFFLNFYDGLMSYSGVKHVDWWMGAVNWSPVLAATEGTVGPGQSPVTIGMLDFTVSNSQKDAKGSLLQYGTNIFSNGHGAAVGSLLVGSVDGSGIMGVMPANGANVIVYDPYDSTNTTNWTDVGTGIQVLAGSTFSKKGAPVGVLNASLGVPGWTLNPGWNGALSSGAAYGHNLVIAAGNDGVTQTTNVPWNFATNPNLMIVGSVGVDGTISNFSNRPGEACLLDTASSATSCTETNKLKYRFIVAPGELILVSDGAGGVTRQSGTSLAAPLVSGAIALLQARWPWLANYPNETAQIILKSATPLGANPGADPVYGVGELNIQASQSPLNWSALQYYSVAKNLPAPLPMSVSGLVSTISTNAQATFTAAKLYVSGLETVGNTYRDFQIPLTSALVGQNVQRASGSQVFQSYLTTPLQSWVAGAAPVAGGGPEESGFAGFIQSSVPVGRVLGMDLRMDTTPNTPAIGYRQSNVALNTDMALIGRNSNLRFGFGQGAKALDGQDGFGLTSDYQLQRGGANPLLGLASGGAYLDWRMGFFKNFAINAGATERRDLRDLSLFGVVDQASPVGVYAAAAEHVGLDMSLTRNLTLHTSVTRLHENAALLGVQSLDPSDLNRGSTTIGETLGFDLALGRGFMVTASGTSANTTTPASQTLRTGPGGLQSSSAEIALSKANLFSDQDRLRLTFEKSMKVDSGQLRYTTYGVVDRETGALGLINQAVNAAGGRTPLSVEMLYGVLLPKQSAEVSVFLRADSATEDTTSTQPYDVMVGGKYRIVF